MHIHNTAHELFFVLAGKGEAVFGEVGDGADAGRGVQRVVVGPGDVAVFPPGVVHGVDNPGDSQLYCLQMMLPNEAFVEWVRSGQEAGSLDVSALQRLAAAASCG
jgi:mannose-6-phosphate isomerase-like protein (cupin superfamily)